MQDIVKRYPARAVCVVGDFNVSEVTWQRDAELIATSPVVTRASQRAYQLLEFIDMAGLRQWVTDPTRGDNFLDLVFSRRARVRAVVRPGIFESDHSEIWCHVCVNASKPSVVTRKSALNYKRADFDGLRRALDLVPWTMLEPLDMNDAVNMFYDFLESAIRDYVPTVELRRRFPPWYDADVRAALRAKETAFNRVKRNRTPAAASDFADKRREFKSISCAKYHQYIRGMIGDFKSNPKRWWTFLKSVKGQRAPCPHFWTVTGR